MNHLSQAVKNFALFLETSAPLSLDKDFTFFRHLICKSHCCSESPGLSLNYTFNMWFVIPFLCCEVQLELNKYHPRLTVNTCM